MEEDLSSSGQPQLLSLLSQVTACLLNTEVRGVAFVQSVQWLTYRVLTNCPSDNVDNTRMCVGRVGKPLNQHTVGYMQANSHCLLQGAQDHIHGEGWPYHSIISTTLWDRLGWETRAGPKTSHQLHNCGYALRPSFAKAYTWFLNPCIILLLLKNLL